MSKRGSSGSSQPAAGKRPRNAGPNCAAAAPAAAAAAAAAGATGAAAPAALSSPARRSKEAIQRRRAAALQLKTFTAEQKAILKLAKPPMGLAPGMAGSSLPSPSPSSSSASSSPAASASAASSSSSTVAAAVEHRVVRIMAAAGAGKTTTLLMTLRKLLELGHRHVVYCVFNKKNAAEAQTKTGLLGLDFNATVTCATIDALAFSVVDKQHLRAERKSDASIQRFIGKRFKDDIDRFLGPVPPADLRPAAGRRSARINLPKCCQFVAYVIFKTLEKFLQSDKRSQSCCRPTPSCPRSPCPNCQKYFEEVDSKPTWPEWKRAMLRREPRFSCQDDFFATMAGDDPPWNILFYPAKLWHNRDAGIQEKRRLKCPPKLPDEDYARKWYADKAKEVWSMAQAGAFHNYATIAKAVQLNEDPVFSSPRIAPPTALLVDEAQDLNPAKFDWLAQQARRMQVFFVGDAMQLIYHFAGSRSSSMMQLDKRLARLLPSSAGLPSSSWSTSKGLTTSFRFGQNIANAANVVILAKEKSKQHRTFVPYRVTGAGGGGPCGAGCVTEHDLLSKRDANGKFVRVPPRLGGTLTVLCRTNVGVLNLVLGLLGDDPTVRIALNGGTDSGHAKFVRICEQMESFYNVFAGTSTTLPFDEWRGIDDLTWQQVEEDVQDKAAGFQAHVSVLNEYAEGSATHGAPPYGESVVQKLLAKLQGSVLTPAYDNSEAEVIFGTVFTAKGLEWGVVQLGPDLVCNPKRPEMFLCDRKAPAPGPATFSQPPSQAHSQPGFMSASQASRAWEQAGFGFRTGGAESEVNLLYVAITRAKHMISVPRVSLFAKLLRTLKYCQTALWHRDDPDHDAEEHARQFSSALFHGSDDSRYNGWVRDIFKEAAENVEAVNRDVLDGSGFALPQVVLVEPPAAPQASQSDAAGAVEVSGPGEVKVST